MFWKKKEEKKKGGKFKYIIALIFFGLSLPLVLTVWFLRKLFVRNKKKL